MRDAPVQPAFGRTRPHLRIEHEIARVDHGRGGNPRGDELFGGLSRVLMVTYSVIQADTIFWQVGAVDGNHVVTHDDRGLPGKKPPQKELHGKIVRYIMGHLAQLLTRLRDTPEGAGNLLDSCAIVATSECGDGSSHGLTEYPMLIAGRAGGALKAGQHYRSPNQESISKAMLTALHAVDPGKFTSFGKNEGLASEPIGALLA